MHDKDVLPDGEPKKPHYHFLVQLVTNHRGSWFKQFNSDDKGIVFPKPVYSPQGAYDYLVHNTPTARKDGKYRYDDSERTSTIESLEADNEELDEAAKLLHDIEELVHGRMTWTEFFKIAPKRVYSVRNAKEAYSLMIAETYGTPNAPPKKIEAKELPKPEAPKPTPSKPQVRQMTTADIQAVKLYDDSDIF
ncbi:MAG: replication protein [Firmicutes bacterium]|nr:replication protein [Bacillota bacterium]